MADIPALAVVIRWGTFSALLLIAGAVVFRGCVLGRLASQAVPADTGPAVASYVRFLDACEQRIAAWGLAGALVLVPLAVGRLGIQVAELRDPGEPWIDPALMMLQETTWGIGWWLQMAAALLCALGFLLVRGRRRARSGWFAATIGGVALAVTPALSGHAVGTPRWSVLAVVGDTLHVLGAGAWLGTLALALTAVLDRRRAASRWEIAQVIRAFSPVALVAAAVVVASGTFASWLHMDAVASLGTTTYGRLLAGKIVLFLAVTGLGAWNWRRLTPRLESETVAEQLRSSARIELVVAWLLLLVTAILVASPLPGGG